MVLGFVDEHATIMRNVRELKVNKCEMTRWSVIWNLNTVLRMTLNTLMLGSVPDAPTLYGLLRHV